MAIPLGLVMSYSLTYLAVNMVMKSVIPFVVVKLDFVSVFRYLLYGFFATLLFSLYPSYKASKTNALHAIMWGFEPQKYGKSVKESKLPRFFVMALRNITRRPRRSVLIVLILIFGGAFVVDAEVIRHSVVRAYTSGILEQNNFDIQIYYAKPFDEGLMGEVMEVDGVVSVESLVVDFLNRENFTFRVNGEEISVKLFSNPVALFLDKPLSLYTPEILSGRYPSMSGEVLVSQYIHLKHNVDIGDYIEIYDREDGWSIRAKVVGIARLLQQRGWEFIFSIEDAYRIDLVKEGYYNSILVKVDEGVDVAEVAEKIINETEEYKPINTFLTETIREAGVTLIRVLEGFMVAVTFIIIFSSLIGLVISYQMAFFERKWEIGLLKTLGGTWKEIVKLFVYESIIYALIATPFALILGYYSSLVLVEQLNTVDLFLGAKHYFPINEIFLMALFPIIVALFATLPVIKNALKIEPVKLIRETNI